MVVLEIARRNTRVGGECRNTKRVSLKVNVFCFVAHNRCNKLKTDGQISERP